MDRQLRIEDVAAVKSRVSWGAIVGGSLVALTVYLVLGLFLGGIGLSLTDGGVRSGAVTWYAAIAGIITMIVAMFCGGCVTSVLTVGETRGETLIHGTLTWALVTAITLWMVMMGARVGYNAMLGAAVFTNAQNNANWEQTAREAGVPQDRIDQWKQDANTNTTPQMSTEDVRRSGLIATWSAFVGTVLGIGAAILGALYGAGPTLRLFPVATVMVEQQEVTPRT